MTTLLSVTQAEDLIRRHTGAFGVETVPLDQATGRILRQTIRAERDQPPYDRVMMDGIAIRHSAARDFAVQGTQRAGMPPQTLSAESACFETTTGAVLPNGADTVIPIERLTRDGDLISLEAGYTADEGQFVHLRGQDCRAGSPLLEPGLRLNAPALAVLAANGYAQVTVASLPRIGIISTGDELVPVEGPVRDWEIRRSNEHAIAAALRSRGLNDITRHWVGDDLDATVASLATALASYDVLILSGGVSMGDFDYVPGALARLGVERIFHKIAQRPGKPMWFGIGPQGQRVFALPGNPVSALSCCVRYVVPALLESQGLATTERFTVSLDADVALIPSLVRFVPVRLHHDACGLARATPQPMPTSGDFSHLAQTHGFVELPRGEGLVPSGYHAAFHAW